MEFKTYDEVSGAGVARLNISGFGWNLDAEAVRRIRRKDRNCPDWFALYAVENGAVLAQVGAVYPTIETTEGSMKTGFVWGVVTAPRHTRKGISRQLFRILQERMADDGAEIFVLGTGVSLVAHRLYVSLGYRDFQTINLASRRGRKPGRQRLRLRVRKRADAGIYSLYERANKGKCGFVHRHRNFVEARLTWGWWGPLNNVCTFYRNEEGIGYALVNANRQRLLIREMCCPDKTDIPECVAALEHRFPARYTVCDLHTESGAVEGLAKSGLDLNLLTHGVLMGRMAVRASTIKEFKSLLGYDSGNFFFTTMDSY